ncbi:MAG: serine O-acetyltransferase [Candidatus Geothermincolia bacterium]
MKYPRESNFKRLQEEAVCYLDGKAPSLKQIFLLACFNAAFQLNLSYRLNRRLYQMLGSRRFVWLVPRFLQWCQRIVYSSSISPEAQIGRRFHIYYGMDIVIGAKVKIGDDVQVFNGVTMGSATPGKDEIMQPKVGNRVLVGTGAKLLGGITVGDDVKIGANSVVVHSTGSGVTVVGVPGRVITAAIQGNGQSSEESR